MPIAVLPRSIPAAAVAPQPWRNGGGRTRELLAGPDAEAWRWRISLADVEHDGPFSAYPGVQRWFAVVAGAGVVLDFGDRCATLSMVSEPLSFDGAEAPGCRLLGGPTQDLNLMLQGGARGVMRRATAGSNWDEDWPLRGRFEIASSTLLWGLPPGPATAPSECCWLGVAP